MRACGQFSVITGILSKWLRPESIYQWCIAVNMKDCQLWTVYEMQYVYSNIIYFALRHLLTLMCQPGFKMGSFVSVVGKFEKQKQCLQTRNIAIKHGLTKTKCELLTVDFTAVGS